MRPTASAQCQRLGSGTQARGVPGGSPARGEPRPNGPLSIPFCSPPTRAAATRLLPTCAWPPGGHAAAGSSEAVGLAPCTVKVTAAARPAASGEGSVTPAPAGRRYRDKRAPNSCGGVAEPPHPDAASTTRAAAATAPRMARVAPWNRAPASRRTSARLVASRRTAATELRPLLTAPGCYASHCCCCCCCCCCCIRRAALLRAPAGRPAPRFAGQGRPPTRSRATGATPPDLIHAPALWLHRENAPQQPKPLEAQMMTTAPHRIQAL